MHSWSSMPRLYFKEIHERHVKCIKHNHVQRSCNCSVNAFLHRQMQVLRHRRSVNQWHRHMASHDCSSDLLCGVSRRSGCGGAALGCRWHCWGWTRHRRTWAAGCSDVSSDHSLTHFTWNSTAYTAESLTVHPKIIILSSVTHPSLVLNLWVFSSEHYRRYFEVCW